MDETELTGYELFEMSLTILLGNQDLLLWPPGMFIPPLDNVKGLLMVDC